MQAFNDQQIIASWYRNAAPWVTAVRGAQIESRVLVTNEAILNSIRDHRPATVLDIGCGEGWLVRTLAMEGIDALGVDIVPALIEAARRAGPGRYQTLAYEDLSVTSFAMHFDLVVCNFSLLGKESVEQIFRLVPSWLDPHGMFIVQTLHPRTACADDAYQDGWRRGSWAGFSEQFSEPAPWYFRTIESWQALFVDNGFQNPLLVAPLHPKTAEPASIILSSKLLRR